MQSGESDMDVDHDEGMKEIAERIRRLEQRVNLLTSIADCDSYPFICVCLESGMDSDEVDKTVDLINRAEHSLNTENPTSYSEFEKQLLEIVPAQKNNPEFAKDIILSMVKKDKFYKGYDHFKKQVNGL
jgi:hypothetical protein